MVVWGHSMGTGIATMAGESFFLGSHPSSWTPLTPPDHFFYVNLFTSLGIRKVIANFTIRGIRLIFVTSFFYTQQLNRTLFRLSHSL